MTAVEHELVEKNIPRGYSFVIKCGITPDGEEFIVRQRGFEPPVKEFHPPGTFMEMGVSVE